MDLVMSRKRYGISVYLRSQDNNGMYTSYAKSRVAPLTLSLLCTFLMRWLIQRKCHSEEVAHRERVKENYSTLGIPCGTLHTQLMEKMCTALDCNLNQEFC